MNWIAAGLLVAVMFLAPVASPQEVPQREMTCDWALRLQTVVSTTRMELFIEWTSETDTDARIMLEAKAFGVYTYGSFLSAWRLDNCNVS